MTKRGQFYLIAAIIIILLISGLIAIANKAVIQPRPFRFYDLSKDYEAETSKVIDYGIYNKYSPEVDITEKLEAISETFKDTAQAKDPNFRLVYIYGDKDYISGKDYGIEEAKVTLGVTEEVQAEATIQTPTEREITIKEGLVEVNITGNIYQFELTEEENFYFIIQTTSPAGERTVVVRD